MTPLLSSGSNLILTLIPLALHRSGENDDFVFFQEDKRKLHPNKSKGKRKKGKGKSKRSNRTAFTDKEQVEENQRLSFEGNQPVSFFLFTFSFYPFPFALNYSCVETRRTCG
jgi:hypothetical protein